MSRAVEFKNCMEVLFQSFRAEMTEAALDGYFLGLGDIPIDVLRRSVAHAIRESDRLPMPSELRKLAGMSNNAEDRATGAWLDVQRAIRLGAYKSIDFDDKICNATIRHMGGWPSFCSLFSSAEDEKFLRLEFHRVYKSLSASGVSLESAAPLRGLSQAEVVGGHVVDAVPRRIVCDVNRAQQSMAKITGPRSEVVRHLGVEVIPRGIPG